MKCPKCKNEMMELNDKLWACGCSTDSDHTIIYQAIRKDELPYIYFDFTGLEAKE